MQIQRVECDSQWEKQWGACRALRIGNCLYVGALMAVNERGVVQSPGQPYGQAKYCLHQITALLERLVGGGYTVVRTRVTLRDPKHWEEVARAHRACFGEESPVTSISVTDAFVLPEVLVQIEAEAII